MTSNNEFLNPYNFIPVKTQSPDRKISAADIANGKHPRVRHDVWQAGALHGRISCSLTTETPMVIGGSYSRENDRQSTPTIQHPYRRRHASGKDEIAIPGNTLRGLIGSTVEALSNSALRVLEDRRYSVRKKPNKALNMIGFLQWDDAREGWNVIPCAVTSLRSENNGKSIANSEKYKAVFRKHNGQPALLSDVLPAYVDGVEKDFNSGDWAYARMDSIIDGTIDAINDYADSRYHNGLKVKHGTILGRKILGRVLSEEAYEKLSSSEKANFQCGALRILGGHHHACEVLNGEKERDLPPTKEHECFIPVPLDKSGKEDYCRPLPVSQTVIDRFNDIARERHAEDKRLPYNLKGLRAAEGLQNNQYVYFDVSGVQVDGMSRWAVSEISISAIWREPVPRSAHEFFHRIDGDLLPWSGARVRLTAAESIFGCVSSGAGEDDVTLPALASRLRFSDALLATPSQEDVLGEEVKLQILGAPKPPSPSLYFQFSKSSTAVTKQELSTSQTSALPRGRKWYLHHGDCGKETPWKSRTGAGDSGNKQRICARPILAGTEFRFTIEFANFSPAELELLCAALRPDGKYRHKLGLGKPLGLGTVAIDVDEIGIKNRTYSAYCPASIDMDRIPETIYTSLGDLLEKRGDSNRESALIDSEIRGILETIGNPKNVNLPVCYPRTQVQFDQWKKASGGQEEKLFEWFVNNDSGGKPQALAPVKRGEPLKGLEANAKKTKKKTGKKWNRRR